MPFLYMTVWSLAMIVGLSLWRLHSWGERAAVTLITFLVLLVSQSLFMQFTFTAGLDARDALLAPQLYLQSGPVGWMALLIMPCGWLGPFIGLNMVERLQEPVIG
jgi:hypothetical protein